MRSILHKTYMIYTRYFFYFLFFGLLHSNICSYKYILSLELGLKGKTEETQKTLHCAKNIDGSKPCINGRPGRAPHDYFLPN